MRRSRAGRRTARTSPSRCRAAAIRSRCSTRSPDARRRRALALRAMHVHHGLSPHADAWAAFCARCARHAAIAYVERRVEVARAPRTSLEARRGARATPRSPTRPRAHGVACRRCSRIIATTRPRRCCCSCCAAPDRAGSRRCPPRASMPRGVVVAAAAARRAARRDRRLRRCARACAGSTTRATPTPATRATRCACRSCPRWRRLRRDTPLRSRAPRVFRPRPRARRRPRGASTRAPRYDGATLDRGALVALAACIARATCCAGSCASRACRAPSAARLAAMHRAARRRARAMRASGSRMPGIEIGVHRGRVVVHARAAGAVRARRGAARPIARAAARNARSSSPREGDGIDARATRRRARASCARGAAANACSSAREPAARALKSILQDAGMPRGTRHALPLVFCGDKLAAVPGIGVDPSFAAPVDAEGFTLEWQRTLKRRRRNGVDVTPRRHRLVRSARGDVAGQRSDYIRVDARLLDDRRPHVDLRPSDACAAPPASPCPSAPARVPSSANASCTFGSSSAACSAATSLSITGFGVPFGAYSPCQTATSKPGSPGSCSVGSRAATRRAWASSPRRRP